MGNGEPADPTEMKFWRKLQATRRAVADLREPCGRQAAS